MVKARGMGSDKLGSHPSAALAGLVIWGWPFPSLTLDFLICGEDRKSCAGLVGGCSGS